ncbi:PLC-like phosphodiesterase [Exophiala viscosa]|uniref:PLC-like phosphodiesterase n=1 Tax=Exophiala viscosa TaxID=2486360 RepID=UPI00219093B1|nr:PLC-like phosphodiesterase [Exophiala viscosa]
MQAKLDKYGIENNAKSSVISIPLTDEAWSPFILVGKEKQLVGNNPPTDWMAKNLPYIGCLTLQDIVMPGSHDAGMSEINNAHLGDAADTQTQTLNITGQLYAGARWFDIRPSISHGQFYTNHYKDRLGANGESIADIISDINRFTAKGYKELIILELSQTLNTDAGYEAFTDAQYSSLLSTFEKTLKHLYTGHSHSVITKLPLSDFISTGPAVVIVCDERDTSWLKTNGFQGKGFYSSTQFPVYNSYADTTELATMQKDQYTKLIAQTAKPDNSAQLFLLSWTHTMGTYEIFESAFGGPTLRESADYFNRFLAQAGGTVPYTGPITWVAEKSGLPNIIMIDNIASDDFLTAMAIGLTRFYNTQC